ncbi:helix-turn-helix domain-containing protein [Streptococcus gordonii]|uniref:helix-turn-helix domain-containing protein n=1 Tax=Streptococcus gordonii TaxID=1302 RepID=UPI001C640EF5|nr:helix-turn-helix transcriptional regulator [Streptococcus gordonii]MBW7663919.1 helix-turn-helix domain-containing protein [Streptococcus gordonii]
MNGKKIAEIRKKQKLSQEELADKANVSRSIISFLATVQVVDVKISEATFGSSECMSVQTILLVIYQ